MKSSDYKAEANEMSEELFWERVAMVASQYGLSAESDVVYDAVMNSAVNDDGLNRFVFNSEALGYIASGIEGILENQK